MARLSSQQTVFNLFVQLRSAYRQWYQIRLIMIYKAITSASRCHKLINISFMTLCIILHKALSEADNLSVEIDTVASDPKSI